MHGSTRVQFKSKHCGTRLAGTKSNKITTTVKINLSRLFINPYKDGFLWPRYQLVSNDVHHYYIPCCVGFSPQLSYGFCVAQVSVFRPNKDKSCSFYAKINS